MKCLLVSYTGPGVNSTEHAAAFACGLARLGWNVRLATVTADPNLPDFEFFACHADGSQTLLDRNDRLEPADIVHVWTPRAPIWRFLERHSRLVRGSLVLHLEDNEDEVLALLGGGSIDPSTTLARAQIRAQRLEDWTHPVLARCLAYGADAATILSPDLGVQIPPRTPWLHVFPPLGPQWWGPVPDADLAIDLSLRPTLVYSGGLHTVVAGDFLELCRAVRLLGERGHHVRLVRCGPPALPELIDAGAELAGDFTDLGLLPVDDLRALLARATALVQPGAPTAFNRGRLPAKLAPYLASGTPVVMPSCYGWTGVNPGEHAETFDSGSAIDIAAAVTRILEAPEAARAMGARAAAFARSRFDLEACCAPLDAFYRRLPRRARLPWRVIRKPRVEVPLLLSEAARTAPQDSGLPTANTLLQVALEEVRQPALPPGQSVAVAQLYWPTNEGFLEYESLLRAYQSGRWIRLVFGPGSMPPGCPARFDPGNRAGIFEIAALCYRAEDRSLLELVRSPSAPRPEITPNGTIVALATRHRRIWRWLGTGADPQLLLPAASVPGVMFVECWIRWTPLE